MPAAGLRMDRPVPSDTESEEPMKILSINPGGVSTKIAVYESRQALWTEDLQHSPEQLKPFPNTLSQYEFRKKLILETLAAHGLNVSQLSAVVGRGGLFRPLRAGTYRVDVRMLDDILEGRTIADHPSNLGALLAHAIAQEAGLPAFIVDPVCVDEFEEPARYSGLPGITRRSLLHALNIRATAFKAAERMGRTFDSLNLVVAHLGSGFSICAIRQGKIVDVNNANDGGPFSPQRTGTLPVTQLVELAFSGKFGSAKELNSLLTKKAGMLAYLGTHDLRDVEKRIAAGDRTAAAVLEAMLYQIVKEIGAMAAVLDGQLDAILITGGVAYSSQVQETLRRRLEWLAPVMPFPGENELEALALGALRVLQNQAAALTYEEGLVN